MFNIIFWIVWCGCGLYGAYLFERHFKETTKQPNYEIDIGTWIMLTFGLIFGPVFLYVMIFDPGPFHLDGHQDENSRTP